MPWPQKQLYRAGISAAAIGCALLLVVQDSALLILQKIRFGSIRRVCLASNLPVVFREPWRVEVLDRGGENWPEIFGIFPIPRSFTHLPGAMPQLLLKSTTNHGAVSIHLVSASEKEESSTILSRCASKSICSRQNLYFETAIDSIQIQTGQTIWVTAIDKPLMIGLTDAIPEEVLMIGIPDSPCR